MESLPTCPVGSSLNGAPADGPFRKGAQLFSTFIAPLGCMLDAAMPFAYWSTSLSACCKEVCVLAGGVDGGTCDCDGTTVATPAAIAEASVGIHVVASAAFEFCDWSGCSA